MSFLLNVPAQELTPLFPPKTSLALRRASSLTIYTLNPNLEIKPPPKNRFHEYPVDNRIVIDDADLEQVRDLLQRNCRVLKEPADGAFNPRFGIRALYDSRLYDFILSYECHRIRLWSDDPHPLDFTLLGSPDALVEIFKNRGVPLRAQATPNALKLSPTDPRRVNRPE